MRRRDVAPVGRMAWCVRVRWDAGHGDATRLGPPVAMGLGLLVVMTLLAGGGFLVGVGRPVRPALFSRLWSVGLSGVG